MTSPDQPHWLQALALVVAGSGVLVVVRVIAEVAQQMLS